jgi:hypothetical protein
VSRSGSIRSTVDPSEVSGRERLWLVRRPAVATAHAGPGGTYRHGATDAVPCVLPWHSAQSTSVSARSSQPPMCGRRLQSDPHEHSQTDAAGKGRPVGWSGGFFCGGLGLGRLGVLDSTTFFPGGVLAGAPGPFATASARVLRSRHAALPSRSGQRCPGKRRPLTTESSPALDAAARMERSKAIVHGDAIATFLSRWALSREIHKKSGSSGREMS